MKKNLFTKQLGEYFDTFLPSIHNASENTICAYADSFAIFFEFLYQKKNMAHYLITYKHLTPVLFDEYCLWLKNERRYSVSSLKHRMSAIIAFLKYASKREISAISALTAATTPDLPSVVQTEFPYFTIEEMAMLLKLPNPQKYLGSRDLVVLSFLYETAARADEVCKTKIADVKFGSPTKIRLHGKGNKTREIPVSDEVAIAD